MEQKTEASQAVDSVNAPQVSRLLTVGGMMSNVMLNLAQSDNPDAKQFKELCAKWDAAAHDLLDLRHIFKAQPAPTIAAKPVKYEQRFISPEGAAAPWHDASVETFQRYQGNGNLGDGWRHEVRALYADQPAPTEAAQGEDSARLDAERYQWLLENATYGSVSFDNGDFLDTDDRTTWSEAIDRARASAETGGVKP